jgi:hypothetical protein
MMENKYKFLLFGWEVKYKDTKCILFEFLLCPYFIRTNVFNNI